MATRTISEIYNSMIAEKESFSTLNSLEPLVDDSQSMLDELTSTSKVAIWRLIFFVCAVAIWIHEGLWASYEVEITDKSESMIPATVEWWVSQMLKYQYGDNLIWNDSKEKFEYSVVDSTKQIISQCAVVESNGIVVIKVAKSDGGTGLEKLSSSEKLAVENYVDRHKPAGILTTLISDDPDELYLLCTVYVDNLVIYNDESNPSDPLNGSLILDSTIFPVQDAVENYIQTLDFNGKFFVAALVDEIQSVTGVTNVVINTCQAKYGTLSYSDILTTTEQSYQSNAGHMIIDSTYPLTTSITYYNRT